VPDKPFAYVAAIALFTLPALDVMYDRSQGGSTFEAQAKRHGVMLDEGLRRGVVAYLERFRSKGKDLIKYVDITPRWRKDGIESFPKTFPEFVLKDVALCPYSGFNYYLSSRADYMATIPYGADGCFHPDWERLRTSGADFIVALESDLPKLAPMTGDLGLSDIHKLPDGIVLAPLASSSLRSRPSEDALYDNGYVRVVRGAEDQLDSAAINLALNAVARQSSEGGGQAARAVDGNTSGVFTEGSVTHTGSEPGAWLEIDLGTSQPIGSVRLWNRTEVPYRLSDYWLTITDTPADVTQKTAVLKEESTPGLWQKRVTAIPRPSLTIDTSGAEGRYLRIQLARQTPHPENVLSLAEVEASPPGTHTFAGDADTNDTLKVQSFSSNDANTIKLVAESSEPVTVKYLLWNNPQLRYQLNGKTVVPRIHDGLAVIGLPPGRNALTITYHNRLLTVFWLGYLAYAVLAGLAFLTSAVEAARTRTLERDARGRDSLAISTPSV